MGNDESDDNEQESNCVIDQNRNTVRFKGKQGEGNIDEGHDGLDVVTNLEEKMNICIFKKYIEVQDILLFIIFQLLG